MAGLFVSFEGIDKSGKSTQAKLLVDYLKTKNHEVVFTHEPGGTELGKEIRHLALTWKPQSAQSAVDPTAEIFLFAADRAQHVAEKIRPALAEDKIVITDRYVDSTLAYQGYGRGLDLQKLETVQQIATGGLLPDLTVWVDVDLATSRSRFASGEGDRLEAEADKWFERVRMGYEKLCLASPARFIRIDGRGRMEEISHEIQEAVNRRLEEHLKIKNV